MDVASLAGDSLVFFEVVDQVLACLFVENFDRGSNTAQTLLGAYGAVAGALELATRNKLHHSECTENDNDRSDDGLKDVFRSFRGLVYLQRDIACECGDGLLEWIENVLADGGFKGF